ncbi:YveK family protein [Paenibacillus dakarensis]|uniref:YveK family protein n=1 Tax=Paenibacillus dakarensis TaxID=1527293 RepID=UPI0006D56845|nr:Wzz/FepE/Etk N-terminal domain-containing protein [Paenibacillus dakarensis]
MSRELDLRDIFRIIRKRIWLIALIVVLVCSFVGVYSIFVKKPVFEASTKIVVNQTPTNSTVNQLDLNQINTNIQLINTYKEVIKTPAILDQVVNSYPEFQLTTEDLSKMVNVNSVNNTQVMTVVVRNTSYVKAAEIANAISKVFQKEIPSIFNVQNVSILNEAKTEPLVRPQPVEPNIILNLMIGFVVSLMLGVGLTFVLEYLDDTIKTEEDVKEFLEIPTLAMITRVNQNDRGPSRSISTSRKGGKEHVSIAE